MFSGFFDKTKAALNLGLNFTKVNSNPTTYAEIKANQDIRYQSIVDAMASLHSTTGKDLTAVKIFWATQTLVLIRFLTQNKQALANFGITIDENNLSKHTLVAAISLIEDKLKNGSLEEKKQLIEMISSDSKAALTQVNQVNSVSSSNDKPELFILKKNSLDIIQAEIAAGRKIVVMDAANAQRPGAGAYEQGTFQEALTRNSDLYWKVLADFRNVVEEMSSKSNLQISENDKAIDVLDFQCRYLDLILFFVKKSIKDPNYFASPEFRMEFFTYNNRIYGDMQNKVFELPVDGGFAKNCVFFAMDGIKDTDSLFDNENKVKTTMLEKEKGRGLIVEVAAPDKRKLESRYDLSSAMDSTRRQSNNDQIADKMIRDAITFTLNAAISNNADTILLNAYGCGAFDNKPWHVAEIFAEVLAEYKDRLIGKKIVFSDLNPASAYQFGDKFSTMLADHFSVNPLPISGGNISLQLNKFGSPKNVSEAVVIPRNDNFIPMTGLQADLTKEGKLIANQTIYIENSEFKGKPKNYLTIKQVYNNLFEQLAKNDEIDTIHFPLLGTGNLKFHPLDSMQAFLESVEESLEKFPQLRDKKIIMHIVDDAKNKYAKFNLVNDWIWNKSQMSEGLEAERYFKIALPDNARQKAFIGGIIGTEARTIFTDSWNVWNKISENLYLGKIPTTKEAEILKNEKVPNLGLILSCVEDFELAGYNTALVSDPIQRPIGWETQGVKNHQVIVRDLVSGDFPPYQVIRAVAKALDAIEHGESVYVHCKAGRSRSATVVFLIEYFLELKKNPDVAPNRDEIQRRIKSLRQEISISSNHRELIDRVIKMVKADPSLIEAEKPFYLTSEFNPNNDNLQEQITAYLTSHSGKRAIMQMSWFKEIKIQAIKHPNTMSSIQNLLNEIYNAKDSTWLSSLVNQANIDPAVKANFQNQLIDQLATQLNMDKTSIEAVLPILKLSANSGVLAP